MLKWDQLPPELQTKEVRPYYNYLREKRVLLFVKREFDFIFSLLLLIIFMPVLLGIAIWIKLDSPGPVFYRQIRVTANNRDFKIFKFRTMVQNADKLGGAVTVERDSRITRAGEKLRKSRLDELPQLLNILKGEMSFVGTRPDVREYVDKYLPEMYATLLLPAGVTSKTSLKFKNEDEIIARYIQKGMNADEAYINYVLPQKMKYNLYYLKRFSALSDIHCIVQTVLEVWIK